MKLFIGLGNPGAKYQGNRHNAGHMFIDWMKDTLNANTFQKSKSTDASYTWVQLNGEKTELLKTGSFMNVSGGVVKGILTKHPETKLDQLYIVHDDLDIPFGKFKIQFGTGPKHHNGIRSIEESLGTEEFWRIRIGVDARPSNSGNSDRVDGETYSLQDFTPEEQQQLQSVFQTIYKQLTQ